MKFSRQVRLPLSPPARKLFRKSAPHPERILVPCADFQHVERIELDVGDAAGQRFARLPQEVHRGRSQQQKPSRSPASPASTVDQAAQALEQARRAVDLVEDDQPLLVICQIQLGIGELGAVRGRLQVEIHRVHRTGDFESERRLADLARTEQGDGRILCKQAPQPCLYPTSDHPCNYGLQLQNCKDALRQKLLMLERLRVNATVQTRGPR